MEKVSFILKVAGDDIELFAYKTADIARKEFLLLSQELLEAHREHCKKLREQGKEAIEFKGEINSFDDARKLNKAESYSLPYVLKLREREVFGERWELCPHCGDEFPVEEFKLLECPHCGEAVKPCSLCTEGSCANCPLDDTETAATIAVRFLHSEALQNGLAKIFKGCHIPAGWQARFMSPAEAKEAAEAKMREMFNHILSANLSGEEDNGEYADVATRTAAFLEDNIRISFYKKATGKSVSHKLSFYDFVE